MADRVKRLKGLVATQRKVEALHEARHAGLLAQAQAASAEAEEVAARAYGEGSLAMLFPELYAQRIEAAFRRRDESLLAAKAEASQLATARMRAEKLADMHRTAREVAERAATERDNLEYVTLTVRSTVGGSRR